LARSVDARLPCLLASVIVAHHLEAAAFNKAVRPERDTRTRRDDEP